MQEGCRRLRGNHLDLVMVLFQRTVLGGEQPFLKAHDKSISDLADILPCTSDT